MKLNKKGFMLAEVTVVATLAAVVMMSMYASSIKVINAYKERENYYDVDTIYATGYIYNYMLDKKKIDNFIENSSNKGNKSDDVKNIDNTHQLETLLSNYNITDIRFVKSKTSEIQELINNNTNDTKRTFKNYLKNYVLKNVSNEDGKYMLIVEREVASPYDSNKKTYYYYSVEV